MILIGRICSQHMSDLVSSVYVGLCPVCVCFQVLYVLGVPNRFWPRICSQRWCQSWERLLQAPWKKKYQKWLMQPPVWKSWWSCWTLLVRSLPHHQHSLSEKSFCGQTNGLIPGLWKGTGIHLPLLQSMKLSSTLLWTASLETPQDIGVLEVRSMLDTSPRCATAFLLVSAPPSCWLCHKYGLLVHFLLTRSMQLDSTWVLGKIEKITQGWLWKRPWAPGSWKDHGRVPGS